MTSHRILSIQIDNNEWVDTPLSAYNPLLIVHTKNALLVSFEVEGQINHYMMCKLIDREEKRIAVSDYIGDILMGTSTFQKCILLSSSAKNKDDGKTTVYEMVYQYDGMIVT